MNPRYLLIAGHEGMGQLCLRQVQSCLPGLQLVFESDRLALFVAGAGGWLPLGVHGCLAGHLFHRHGAARPIGSLDRADTEAILLDDDRLLNSFWGGYVVARWQGATIRLLRDPSGALPCYLAQGAGFAAAASDADILVTAGLVGAHIHWDGLARHFYTAGVPTPETALAGITELLPGFAIDVPGTAAQVERWSPWSFVADRGEGVEAGAERLGRVVTHCVRAWAHGGGRLLLSLSGGLDSSIVGAALAGADAELIGLNMFAEDRSGDERSFARALADHLDIKLVERRYALSDIAIEAPLGPHLPRTKDRSHALAYERMHLAVAAELGVDAFVTGNGGDSLFGYSQSAAAIADRYLCEGLGAGTMRTLRNVCRQTGSSLADAALSAWRLVRAPPGYRVRTTPLFLHPERLAALLGAPPAHPWLDAPAGALPGKAAHIAAILRVQQCFEPHRSLLLPVLNPLMSQPILEACLAVPSWQWRDGGRDRALARRAFENRLPPLIVRRRMKGGPDGFAAALLDRLRPQIRDRLLEGHLVRRGIADRSALEAALATDRPTLGEERVRLFEFLAAEAWLDAWLARAA